MFENHQEPLLNRRQFFLRALKYFFISMGILAFSLSIGIFGYHYFDGLSWVDSLLNASMILTGMGPVDTMKTNGVKLFASCYAIYSGIAFQTVFAVLLAPAVHRFIHIIHLESEQD